MYVILIESVKICWYINHPAAIV